MRTNSLLENFYRETFPNYVKRISHLCKIDPSTAEDIVQDAFIKAFKYIHNFNPEKGPIEAWFSTILYRTMANKMKKSKNENFISLDQVEIPDTSSENFFINIEKHISRFGNEKEREVLFRRLILEQSYKTISEEVPVSVNNIKRIYKKFRKSLLEE